MAAVAAHVAEVTLALLVVLVARTSLVLARWRFVDDKRWMRPLL